MWEYTIKNSNTGQILQIYLKEISEMSLKYNIDLSEWQIIKCVYNRNYDKKWEEYLLEW